MKILHVTDIHSKKSLIDKISDDLVDADIILISGDITHFGNYEETNTIIKDIQKYNKSILGVPGNCDYPGVNQCLEEHTISLDRKSKVVNEFLFIGMGGSLPCPGQTPNEYPEEVFKQELNNLYNGHKNHMEKLILLIHQPPVNTKNDRIKFGLHVGSNEVRKFIEEKQPLLVLSGHIHEGKGVDRIGKTKIVNPGAFREGNYSVINIQDSEISINLKKI